MGLHLSRAPLLQQKNAPGLLTLAVILTCLNIGAGQFAAVGAPAIITFNAPAFAWSVAAGQGAFYFPITISYAGWVNDGSTIAFDDLTYAGTFWGMIGFSAVTAGSTMTLIDMGADLTYMQSGGVQLVYCPSRGEPNSIVGGAMAWNPATDTVTVTTAGVGLVTLTWTMVPPVVVPPDAVQAAWLAGDFLGGVSLIYTQVLGPAFYGIIILLVMLPIYMKTESIVLPMGVAILLAGFFEIMMPAPALDFARFVVIVGVAAGLFLLVTRGRSGS